MSTCDQCRHSVVPIGDQQMICRLNPPVPMLAGVNRMTNAPLIVSAWPTVPPQGTCSHVEVAVKVALEVPK